MLENLFKLIRWPNLIIVFITQAIVWFQLIGKSLQTQNLNSNLSLLQFFLLSLCTVVVAASGYVINDIEDIKIDLINKPDKVIVGKLIMTNNCYTFYYSLLGVGFLIALSLAWQLDRFPYVLLYPISVGALHLYAVLLKKTMLLGNILISLFVAAVPLIIFLADANQFPMSDYPRLYFILFLYALLAFLSNLAREVVKDMQDLKGDKIFGANTFPIKFGFKASKGLIYIILLSIFVILTYWTFIYDTSAQTNISILLGSVPLLLIVAALIVNLVSIKTAKEFGKWSLGIKLFMLFGLIFLYLQPI